MHSKISRLISYLRADDFQPRQSSNDELVETKGTVREKRKASHFFSNSEQGGKKKSLFFHFSKSSFSVVVQKTQPHDSKLFQCDEISVKRKA